jgi:hypothetical protein
VLLAVGIVPKPARLKSGVYVQHGSPSVAVGVRVEVGCLDGLVY